MTSLRIAKTIVERDGKGFVEFKVPPASHHRSTLTAIRRRSHDHPTLRTVCL
jgi:hypothetical protein